MEKESVHALSAVRGTTGRAMLSRGIWAAVFNVLLTLIVMLNAPLSWFLNATFGFYALRWIFWGSAFHAWVAIAALLGGVLVKYIVLRRGSKAPRR